MTSQEIAKLQEDAKKRLEKLQRPLYGSPHSRLLVRTMVEHLMPPIRTVVDCCASDSRWSRDVIAPLLPEKETHYLLVEANDFQPYRVGMEEFLKVNRDKRKVVWKGAWDREGDMELIQQESIEKGQWNNFIAQVHEPGAKVPGWDVVKRTPIKTIRLDAEVQRQQMPGPYFLKIDGHGSCREILEGADLLLDQTVGIEMEGYGCRFHEKVMLFNEMITYLENRGFLLYSMSDILPRSTDGRLWEVEMFFLRRENPVFSTETFDYNAAMRKGLEAGILERTTP